MKKLILLLTILFLAASASALTPTYVERSAQVVADPVNWNTPTDGTATYGSSTTLVISGLPFTVDDSNSWISYVAYKRASGRWVWLFNGADRLSLTVDSGVITCSQARFEDADEYMVGIVGPTKYDFGLIDADNLAAGDHYYPSTTGQVIGKFENVSFTVSLSGGLMLTIETSSSPDSATMTTWQDITHSAYYDNGTTYGYGATSFVDVSSKIDFDNINARKVRVKIVAGDATNSALVEGTMQ